MTEREIERILEEGRKALAERRNAELRARVAARLARRRLLTRLLDGSEDLQESENGKNREYALFN